MFRIDLAIPLRETESGLLLKTAGRLPFVNSVESVTVPVKLLMLVTVTVVVPDPPCGSVMVAGLAVMRKLPPVLWPKLDAR